MQTPQLAWHGRESTGGKNDPILTVDFYHGPPTEEGGPSCQVIATGGADNFVRLWVLSHTADEALVPTFVTGLEGHGATVNCVRFSPNGEVLASAADGP